MGFKFWLKVLFMIGSFGLVIYGIQKLKSPEFTRETQKDDSALALLLGSDARATNWCAAETKKVEVYSDSGEVVATLTTPPDISAVCEILIGAIPADAATKSQFVRRLVATDAAGKVKTVEQSPNTPYFKIEEMPVSSTALEKVLKRLK